MSVKSGKDLDYGFRPRGTSQPTNKMSWRRQDGSYPKRGYGAAGGYLAQCIADLVARGVGARKVVNKTEYITVPLSGGAMLWWCPAISTLYALRPNGPLQSAEAPTFEKHIKGAGLRCSRAEGATITESELNQWHGVKWLIGEANDKPSNDGAPEQASLL